MATNSNSGALVVGPDESPSYWQPVPANGYAEVRVSTNHENGSAFSSGIQCIAPGGHIREHWHDHNEELLFIYQGTGSAVVDGVTHPIIAGTTIYLPPGTKHQLINEGEGDLMMMWTLLPGGLENFFAAIGRPRAANEASPAPFERPANVEEIERNTVFGGLQRDDTE
jgi:mannose-6-phosphate isomerase-like protein (cupin superfamily)